MLSLTGCHSVGRADDLLKSNTSSSCRVVEAGRYLWRLLRARSTRGDHSRTISHWIWNILMEGEIPHLLWEIFSATFAIKKGVYV